LDDPFPSVKIKIMADIIIIIKEFFPEVFSFVFQQGFMMKVQTGVSVRDVLCTQFGLSDEYIESRISTIFLDGKPVDDIDSSHIKNNATLSLSAAMPGLVGATMRRGGFYASFRNTITYKEDNNTIQQNTDGIIKIKLFNMILKEIGADLLRKGIYVNYDDLKLLLSNKDHNFVKNCVTIVLDGKEINLRNLRKDFFEKELSSDGTVCIKMK
jgi:hypothetical protein